LNAYFAQIGHDGVCVPIHVKPEGLAAVGAGLRQMENLGGVIVTMPHKAEVLALCDEASEVTRQIGAANVLSRGPDGRLTAHRREGEGFVRGLLEAGREVRGKSAYMAGAGGAAKAIAFALVAAAAARLTLANRPRSKAEDLRQRILSVYPQARIDIGTPDPPRHVLGVNAPAPGRAPEQPLPRDAARLPPAQRGCEATTPPQATPLLLAGQARGCPVHSGAPRLACRIPLMGRAPGGPGA